MKEVPSLCGPVLRGAGAGIRRETRAGLFLSGGTGRSDAAGERAGPIAQNHAAAKEARSSHTISINAPYY
jgi:hypothetical protein